MRGIIKAQDLSMFYILMALIIGLSPLLGITLMTVNSSPVIAQGGQLYQPQSWDNIQGWVQNCNVAFPEGARIPQRLVLTNNSLSSWTTPAIHLRFDFYNAAMDAIGIDYHVAGTFKTASSSTGSTTLENQSYTWWQTLGNGTSYTPSVTNAVYPPDGTDCPPGDPSEHHYSEIGPFTIPSNTYLIIYWEAHTAMTLQWLLDPPGCYDPHNGACSFPGASLQTTVHNLGGLKSTQFPVACLEGSICGAKYLDTPPLGSYNVGDTGLEDWVICISGQMPDGTPITVCDNTSGDGSYCFENLNDGTWTVCEQLQAGYTNTSPTRIQIEIKDGTPWADVDFFNKLAEPQLELEKLWTDVNAGSIRPSDNICYSINYGNSGTAAADNVTIIDNPDETWISSVYNISGSGVYDGDTITWDIGTLAPDENGTVSYCIQLADNTTFPAGETTEVENTVCIEPTDPNVCEDATIEVRNEPSLCLDKTWNDVNGLPPQPGDVICYNIGYCSPVLVHNVIVTDDPDETWIDSVSNISNGGTYDGDIITWLIGDFGPGIANVTYCATLKAAGTFPAGITYVNNTACDNATEVPLLCDTETVPVEAFPQLTLEKDFEDVNGGHIVPSDNVCYSINYGNSGTAAADNVTIIDDPDETWISSVYNISGSGVYDNDIITWNIGTVAVGENGTVSYCVTLKAAGTFPAGHTTVRNTSCIEPTDPDICHRRSIIVEAHPDLEINKQANTSTAWPSDNITFTITVCNNGNATDNVTVTDNPDENYIDTVFDISGGGTYDGDIITWYIGLLAPTECRQVTYSTTLKDLNNFPPGITPMVNFACIEPTENSSGICDTTTVEIENDIDLDIIKRWSDDNEGIVFPGDIITYTINYKNNTDTAVDNVVIEDDPNETYVDSISGITDGGIYDGDIITWHIGIVNPGESGSVSYKATLKPGNDFPFRTTEVTNTACIYPTEPTECTTATVEVTRPWALVSRVSNDPDAGGFTVPAKACVPDVPGTGCHVRYISVQPKKVIEGQPVTISANVFNDSNAPATYKLTLNLNGNVEQTQTLHIEPGAAQPTLFTFTATKHGSYLVKVGEQYSKFDVVKPGAQPVKPADILTAVATSVLFVLAGLLLVVVWRRRQGI